MKGAGYRRADLQRLAILKLEDSTILLKHKRYSNAYYLLGYVVEFGLKACISRQFLPNTIPDPDLARKVYTHNFSDLIGLAGLKGNLQTTLRADSKFAVSWSIVSEWNEGVRYEDVDVYTCQTMLAAINDEEHGVLQWLKKHW